MNICIGGEQSGQVVEKGPNDYYNKDSKEKGIAEIIITKCRNGEVGTVRLATDLAHCRFVTLDINHHLLKAEDEERLPF